MKTKVLIGTDIGTSSTKTIIMDTEGNLVCSASADYGVLTPKGLWAEQWGDIWAVAALKTIKEAVAGSGVTPADVAGICISGLYGGSGIPLDSTMKPVRPCIIWMDRRASDQQNWVLNNIGPEKLYDITRNGCDPYYGFTKILWIKDNEPDHWKKIALFLPPNSYTIYKLTGKIAIDYSSAGNIGGIFDMNTRKWSDEMLAAMNVPAWMMPERIVPSCEVVGGLSKEASMEVGLAAGTPVCAGGVDCVVATLGMGVLKPGEHVAIIGTSMTWGFIYQQDLPSRELISMPYVKDPLELTFSFGGAATSGALPKWFRDNFAQIEKQNEENGGENAYQALEKKAGQIPPGSEGLIVLPYFMGERSPIWDVNARGTIFGLSMHHTKEHVYRAIIESIAFSLRDTMESVHSSANLGKELILAGGITKSGLFKQVVADVTGCPVLCPKNDIEANFGDIILAGIGSNVMGYEVIDQWLRFEERVAPDPDNHRIYSEYFAQYKSLYKSLKGNMRDLSKLE
jgi:xylulokinase